MRLFSNSPSVTNAFAIKQLLVLTCGLCALMGLSDLRAQNVDQEVRVSRVMPLYNYHWKFSKQKGITNKGVIDPVKLVVPDAANEQKLHTGDVLNITGARGEMVYFGLLLQSTSDVKGVLAEIRGHDHSNGTFKGKSDLKIVTSWFQSGVTTQIARDSAFVTYELLLDSNENIDFSDGWRKDERGKDWVYQPPVIERIPGVRGRLNARGNKRILGRVQVPFDQEPGVYRFEVQITVNSGGNSSISSVPIELAVLPITLLPIDPADYKLFLFTGLILDPLPGRSRSYMNAQRLHGEYEQRKRVFQKYIEDIVEHGFNGITLKDWRSPYVDDALRISRRAGIENVIVHAASPVATMRGGISSREAGFPVVKKSLVDRIKSFGYQPIFYGYDEVGGNKQLKDQLAMNRVIHKVGGKVMNAIFWDDRASVERAVADDHASAFDMMASSMGSHGQKDFFAQLPFPRRQSAGVPNAVEEFAYWHPNVENPAANRVFMGFWLWASGLSGVIPHGHFFPPYIEKVVTVDDRSAGFSRKTSPYDDWSYWLPGGKLRHHAAVYPAQDGPVQTLQWEGIRQGVTDLRYVVMLERSTQKEEVTETLRQDVKFLLERIRHRMLRIDASYIRDAESGELDILMDEWRGEIQKFLLKIYEQNTEASNGT